MQWIKTTPQMTFSSTFNPISFRQQSVPFNPTYLWIQIFAVKGQIFSLQALFIFSSEVMFDLNSRIII